ncbi:MAG: hypothetical protein JW783_12190 [Bacteroidales bacterium]|nr:hypothetical protein [Bacteroidales bacterium]MBN2748860.1 hypothetical protein [Bacteroidales bacterium]
MEEPFDIPISATALGWVYIIINTSTQELSIGLTFNPSKRITRVTPAEKVVYYRSFTNPFDALAHKHLLEELSRESIIRNVTQQNPTLRNLTSEIGGKD